MAALDLNNFTHSASSYGGYSRTDINNFIRNCYATNDPTNNINRIMTIEEDDEDDDDEEETAVFGESDVSPSVYFEKRHKRIEDWNKVYNSDDENNAGAGSSDGGSIDGDRSVGCVDGNEGDNNTTGVIEMPKESDATKPVNHKYLKVTFADDFGCDLIQHFIIKNTTDDEEEEDDDIEVTADNKNEEGLSADKSDEDDNDNENNPHSPIKGTRFESKFDFSEDVGFESLEMTINKLINNIITISDGSDDIGLCGRGGVDIGGDVDIGGKGGDIDIGGIGGNVDIGGNGGDIDIGGKGGDIGIGGKGGDIDIGGNGGDVDIGGNSGDVGIGGEYEDVKIPGVDIRDVEISGVDSADVRMIDNIADKEDNILNNYLNDDGDKTRRREEEEDNGDNDDKVDGSHDNDSH